MKLPSLARRALLLSMLCTAPAALVGCGGGGGDDSPISSNFQLTSALDYSDVSPGSNAIATSIQTLGPIGNSVSGALVTSDNQQSVSFSGLNRMTVAAQNNDVERRFFVQLSAPNNGKFQVGQQIPLKVGTANTILLRQTSLGKESIWNADGGAVTITSIGNDAIGLRLDNALFVPSSSFAGTGTFALNGPLSASGLLVTN